MLKATGITKSYGNLPILKGVNFEVEQGEIVSIIGASGAGKSTLLHILGTLDKPDGGTVELKGTIVNKLSGNLLSNFRNQNIGFVFQFHHLLPEFTALENICIPAFIANLPNTKAEKVTKLSSQIDLFPTLFALLKWDYSSNFFGKDVFTVKVEDERAYIGNYRKLGTLKDNKVVILDEQKNADLFLWNPEDNSLSPLPTDKNFEKHSISNFQVADDLYRNSGLKIKAESSNRQTSKAKAQ